MQERRRGGGVARAQRGLEAGPHRPEPRLEPRPVVDLDGGARRRASGRPASGCAASPDGCLAARRRIPVPAGRSLRSQDPVALEVERVDATRWKSVCGKRTVCGAKPAGGNTSSRREGNSGSCTSIGTVSIAMPPAYRARRPSPTSSPARQGPRRRTCPLHTGQAGLQAPAPPGRPPATERSRTSERCQWFRGPIPSGSRSRRRRRLHDAKPQRGHGEGLPRGITSTFPARSRAATSKRCAPAARSVSCDGRRTAERRPRPRIEPPRKLEIGRLLIGPSEREDRAAIGGLDRWTRQDERLGRRAIDDDKARQAAQLPARSAARAVSVCGPSRNAAMLMKAASPPAVRPSGAARHHCGPRRSSGAASPSRCPRLAHARAPRPPSLTCAVRQDPESPPGEGDRREPRMRSLEGREDRYPRGSGRNREAGLGVLRHRRADRKGACVHVRNAGSHRPGPSMRASPERGCSAARSPRCGLAFDS